MVYSLTVTIAAAVVLFALLGVAAFMARRAAGAGGVGPVAGWRWNPSPLGFLVLVPLAGLLLWRLFPAVLLVPVIFPFFMRGRRPAGRTRFFWASGRRAPLQGDDNKTIDGQWRSLDK
jgi:hypothetical protein